MKDSIMRAVRYNLDIEIESYDPKIKEFDLALRKFITKVNNTHVKSNAILKIEGLDIVHLFYIFQTCFLLALT